MKYSRVFINSFAYELAPEAISSRDLESRLAPLYQKLRIPMGQLTALTGIEERRWWPKDHRLSDGAIIAAQKSIQETNISIDDFQKHSPILELTPCAEQKQRYICFSMCPPVIYITSFPRKFSYRCFSLLDCLQQNT